MKKTDIALVIFIALVSVLVAYFVAGFIFGGGPGEMSETVKTATPVSDTIVEPDAALFNENALNPTVEVCVGGGCPDPGTPSTPGNGADLNGDGVIDDEEANANDLEDMEVQTP